MKRLLLPFLLLITLIACQQKRTTPPINEMYFLVGTLNDYMGREVYKKMDNRVDRYYQSEKNLCTRIYSMFKDKYPDLELKVRKLDEPERKMFALYSESLADMINDYYTYKASNRMAYSGEADFETLNMDSLMETKDFYPTYYDTIFTGSLKQDIFKHRSEKLSFISEIYARYGQKTDSTHTIRMYNSVSKAETCVKLLKDMGSQNVEYEVIENIPVNNIIRFTPTQEIKSYFKTLDLESYNQ